MDINIYFATDRLTITSTTDQGGFELSPNAQFGIEISELLELFRHHKWVTIITSNDSETEQIFELFSTQFKYVIAAGGVVERDDKRILMIHRNGRWDIPKGHWEQGESIEECAIREVEEESGVSGITLRTRICDTLHCYYMKGRWELKRTSWYAMQSSDLSPLTPQTEEGIERAEWLTLREAELATTGSFPTIQYVMSEYLQRHQS